MNNRECSTCKYYDTDLTDQPCCSCMCSSNWESEIVMGNIKENIIAQLTYFKEQWRYLTEIDNLYLIGKIEAMEEAIRIVNAEFDKSEVEGE